MRRRNAVYVRRNVKRVAWHAAIGVGLFFAVRLVWGWQADREYARLAKKLEARGISLDQTQQPGPDNPVTILLHASAAATRLTDSDRRLLNDGDVPYDPKVGVTDTA